MRRVSLVAVAGAVLAAAPVVLLASLHEVEVRLTGTVHFYAVGFSALVAAAAAAGLTVLGSRRGDTRTMVVGTAFAVMASLLALPLRRVLPADHPRMVATTRAVAERLSAGDGLLYRTRPGVAARGFAALVDAIAWLAWCPGGVRIFGQHWEAPSAPPG